MGQIKEDCIKRHQEIKAAQREVGLEELLTYKGDENIIYYNRITRCPICGADLKIGIELKTIYTTDGYLD